MFFRVIDKERLPDLVKGLATEYEVIAPVAKGERFVYAPVSDPADIRLDYDTTLLPPKKYFFPPEETLMRFRVADNEVLDDEVFAAPRVLFGLHPCDINALLLMDNVFTGRYEDPYYLRRREQTLLIGVSCTPSETCFCNVWDTNEVHWGFDVFLTDLGDRYFASCRTVKGAEILDRFVANRQVTDADTTDFQRVVHEFQKRVRQDRGHYSAARAAGCEVRQPDLGRVWRSVPVVWCLLDGLSDVLLLRCPRPSRA